MSLTTESMTPADIGAIVGSPRDNSGFGDGNGAWWIIILFIFAFCGWGGNWGGNNGAANTAARDTLGVMDGYTINSDFAQLNNRMNQIGDALGNGICDSTFTLNNNLQAGFNGVNNAITTNGYETRNAVTGIGTQLASCCCDVREAISGVNYNNAMAANSLQSQIDKGFCDTNYAQATNTTAIVQNAHNDTDRVIAKLNDMEATRQQERIAELQSENQSLKFTASQQAQNAYLVNALNPYPVPSYTVCNPYTGRYGYGCANCNS